MFRRWFVIMTCIALSISGAGSGQEDVLKARPIPLNQVRLLEGPFKHAMELDGAYLLRLDADRLLSRFRENAGLPGKAKCYGGWESQKISGHTLGHYLSACSMMYAASGDDRYNERVTYIVDELAVCQEARGDGFIGGMPDIDQALKEIAAGDIRAQSFDLNGLRVPWYNLHKLFAGLLDAHKFSRNKKALDIVEKLADWAIALTENLDGDQFQLMLTCEHGGMNESLAELYSRMDKAKYLNLSRRFHHKEILDPLAMGKDILPGLHANTQVPKIIGVARRYQLAGNQEDRYIAEFFWDRVVKHHSYVIGGHSDDEHFGPPDQLNDRLSWESTETCNTYNMLKLTRLIFGWEPSVEKADFYERALYNHILASQNPDDGMMTYGVPLKPGYYKRYCTPFDSFWCCTGTGIENHVKYGDSIYFEGENSLYVNLFIPSEMDWRGKGVTVRQETRFPEEDTMHLSFRCEKPVEFTLLLRCPGWAADLPELSVNGEPKTVSARPGSYLALRRTWRDGDTVTFRVPMTIHLESMPDNPNRIAVLYGPIVLAGDLGPIEIEVPWVPVFVTENKALEDCIEAVPGQALTFRTKGVGKPGDVTLSPLYAMHHQRYSVYWDIFSQEQWKEQEAGVRAEQARIKALEARTVDRVRPGEQQSEVDHALAAHEGSESDNRPDGRRFRHAPNGWFSYEVAVTPDTPVELMCTYWGADSGDHIFDILIDGQVVATQILDREAPGKYFDVIYPIAESITRGKEKVTLMFRAHPDQTAGGVSGCQILRVE